MTRTSEYVSAGHPDKIADAITSFILDRYLEADPNVRYAVEALIKDETVTLAGEITSEVDFSPADLTSFAQIAVLGIGYDRAYQDAWGATNTICGDDIRVECRIGRQSPDIARGIGTGWGDQGIFTGMATGGADTDFLTDDYFAARKLCRAVTDSGVGGLDVKTQVTAADGAFTDVVVAVPLKCAEDEAKIRAIAGDAIGGGNIVVNGTGRYVVHGPVGDTGLTGRKLVCDFYGSGCRVGGGSPWGKDPTKADVALNVYARKLAREYLSGHGMETVFCDISCCIGRPEIGIVFSDGSNREVERRVESRPPMEIIDELGLRRPEYYAKCVLGNLFGE